MAPRKRQRQNNSGTPPSRRLPADLLLAIAAWSDPRTIVRCAATCKTLRREIADGSFIRQAAAGVVPTCVLLAYTRRHRRQNRRRKPFVSLVHPATPAALSFADKHLAPFVARSAANDLLGRYDPVTSRGGLIVLLHRHLVQEHRDSDLCVYDPMTGDRTFLSTPPGISFDRSMIESYRQRCVLLTAADGISSSSSFMLLFADRVWHRLRVQTAAPSDAGDVSWGPVTEHYGDPIGYNYEQHQDAVVLHGGVVHWLQHQHGPPEILTYDVGTGKLGTLKLPAMPLNNNPAQLHLRMSPDRRLRFLRADLFVITIWKWIQLLSSHGWEREAVIDMKEKLRLFESYVPVPHMMIQFERSGSRERNNTVMFWINYQHTVLIVLDLETKKVRRQDLNPSLLFEIHLSERLQAMKIFS